MTTSLICFDSGKQASAESIAVRYGFVQQSQPPQQGIYLALMSDYLALCQAQKKPFYIDFLGGKTAYRRQHRSLKKEFIARACGLQQGRRPSILDVTAGFGSDSFILAQFGCAVTCIERHPIIAALLEDAIGRACHAFPDMSLQFVYADAMHILRGLKENEYPDVIYLDPMFPARRKTALVKQSMRVLRHIVGEDPDAEILFHLSLQCAKQRVVVKRPRLAPPLAAQNPDVQLKGKANRFDVYITGH